MKLFRAVPKANFVQEQKYFRLKSQRTPTNIHYVVDNIWEFLRPENYPNRRHCAYASPTKELALGNASSVGYNKDDYFVCEVVFNGNFKFGHLNLTDARNHTDNFLLKKHVLQFLGKDFSNLPLFEKSKYNSLFLPVVLKDELVDFFNSNELLKELGNELKHYSKFWQDTSLEIHNHNGELFFEPIGESYYQLQIINQD
jgi:hypothetical protein